MIQNGVDFNFNLNPNRIPKKKYNPDKMKTDIPADVLNQTDSDDFWVAICAGILGIGIGASIERIYGSYRR